MAQVGWHGATDGLEYEDGPPVPVLEWGWSAEPPIDARHLGIRPDGSLQVQRAADCTCPWCRAVNAPATGDQ